MNRGNLRLLSALLLVSSTLVAEGGFVPLIEQNRLEKFTRLLPQTESSELNQILKSSRTIWYDRNSLTPGYQDSWGDNVVGPVGMRPNTIRAGLIDLAVPGGHRQIFEKKGTFNFPFGTTAGLHKSTNVHVLTFWSPPFSEGKVLPVAYWQVKGYLKHRYRWVFPKGTMFGEVLYVTSDNLWRVFEIRTRKRYSDSWATNVWRPFPSAKSLHKAVLETRKNKAEWVSNKKIDGLIKHLQDSSTFTSETLESSYYAKSWEPVKGYLDYLPDVDQPDFIADLLAKTVFKSSEGEVWKRVGEKEVCAASSKTGFSIVPNQYLAGLIPANDVSCSRCHNNAGRPFEHFYPDLVAYGEIWGEDEIFSWHPFQTDNFVNSSGAVQNFNYDNRVIRTDFLKAGLVEPYDANRHPETLYKQLPSAWRK